MNPSVLLVRPGGFSMGWRGATPRIIDLATVLVQRGWTVSMVAGPAVGTVDQTAQEAAFPGTIFRTPFGGAYLRWLDQTSLLRRANRALWKLQGPAQYHRAVQLGWAARLVPWARNHWPGAIPDVVWAICSSNVTGAAAGRYLAHCFSRPLVLELHDPPLSVTSGALGHSLQRTLTKSLAASSAVVTTTKAYATHLTREYALRSERVVPIYLSYRGSLAAPKPRRGDGPLVLMHAGLLTASRGKNAGALLRAVAAVFAQHPECRGGIRLRLLGGGNGTTEFKKLAKRLNVADALECAAEVPYDQVAGEMASADVLVVVKYAEQRHDMQIPGKLFVYLGTGKPILGVMEATTEAADILRHSGVGIVPNHNSVEELSRCIHALWNHRHRLHVMYRPVESFVKQFSLAAMADRVQGLLQRVGEA